MAPNVQQQSWRTQPRETTGQWDEHIHSDPQLNLEHGSWPGDLGKTHYTGQWGEVDVAYGARTPWGPAQHGERVADGIVFVPTDGHGGYKLSPERNAAIPPAYRKSSGWYEEDCERHIVEFYHHDAVWPDRQGAERAESIASRDESLRDWFPDQWEKVNKRELEPGESSTKDERVWGEENADEYVSRAVQTIEDGLLLVTARRESTGDEDRFVLTPAQYDEAKAIAAEEPGATYRFRVPADVKPQPRPEPAPPKPVFTTVPTAEGLTAAAAKKLDEDLGKRWRLDDGRVLTLRQQIEQGHITGKRVIVSDTGTRQFYLEDGGNGVMKVSKATFDAFEAPDRRTAKDLAREEWYVAQGKQQKAQRAVDQQMRPTSAQFQALRDARAATDAAYATYKALEG